MSNCTVIPANADVSGIGIRVNLYITTLLMAVIPETPATLPLLEVLIANAGVSGVALLITAIVQTVQKQLSLYHAIFIIHMLYFLGVAVVPTGRYRGNICIQTIRALTSFIVTYGTMMLFTGFAIYVWAAAPQFGSTPECNNEIKYIFFFRSVRATVGWLRKLWMAGLGISLAFLIFFPLLVCMCSCLVNSGSGSWGSGGYSSGEPRKLKVSLFAGIYAVIMLELYVKRNKNLIAEGENQWSFGQIYALIMILATLNEFAHFIIGLGSPEEEDSLGPRQPSQMDQIQGPDTQLQVIPAQQTQVMSVQAV
ncbi:hypothetical protein AX17_006689 [Amanita inopinata Kibby_2008]|nr:hypothetical protein AX17_006689 [Amanita inopinata Kibby_2008]